MSLRSVESGFEQKTNKPTNQLLDPKHIRITVQTLVSIDSINNINIQ